MKRQIVFGACAALSLLAAACSSGASETTSSSGATTVAPTTSEQATVAPTTVAPTTSEQATAATVGAYFLLDERLHVVGRAVAAATPADAVRALLAGPSAEDADAGLVSLVPAGTRLRGVTVSGSQAVVDLSAQFDSGGGNLSVMGRVAQVVFTVTQFDGIDTVRFSIDGVPVTELTGEGYGVDGVQRLDVADLIPIVLLESPWAGQTVAQPIAVSGVSNTFEAQVNYELVGMDGVILTEGWLMATSGTGTWGTFDAVLSPLPTGTTGDVRVRLFEVSPKDGEHINVTEVTVHLA